MYIQTNNMSSKVDEHYRGMNEERYHMIGRSRSLSPPSSKRIRYCSYKTHNGTNESHQYSRNERTYKIAHQKNSFHRLKTNETTDAFNKEAINQDQRQIWDRVEAEFQLKQFKNRAEIRIQGGRAHPIDILTAYNDWDQLKMEVGFPDPVTLLEEITEKKELIELQNSISMHLKWSNTNIEFWQVSL
jgi:hypothetical protein